MGKVTPQFYYIASSLLIVIPCSFWCLKPVMSALLRIKNNWFGCALEDEKKEGAVYDELLQDSSKQLPSSSWKRGSVADAVAKFEGSSRSLKAKDTVNVSITPKSCSQQAFSGAKVLFGFVSGMVFRGSEDQAEKTPISKSSSRHCRICEKKLFPTDDTTTCRNFDYHIRCFRCSLCGTKLRNHPGEVHKLVVTGDGHDNMLLQCQQCVIDSEHKNKPRRKARKAGERIVVDNSEQGDVHQVVDSIGDDLEEALYGMIPRCVLCGGDFLSCEGEISIVGSLKYHEDCFRLGRPGAGSSSVTLPPVQAARYLPDNIILKIGLSSGKSLTTLFFVWKDKEPAIKRFRTERAGHIDVTFELDEEARNNPNYKGKSDAKRNATVPLPDWGGGESNLTLEVVGGEKIAPQLPKMIEAPRIIRAYQKPTILQGSMRYAKYGLDHILELSIPYNCEGNTLQLHGAALKVSIS